MKKVWISDNIPQMMNKRRAANNKDMASYQQINREIKKAIREKKQTDGRTMRRNRNTVTDTRFKKF